MLLKKIKSKSTHCAGTMALTAVFLYLTGLLRYGWSCNNVCCMGMTHETYGCFMCSERLQYSCIWKNNPTLVSNGTICFQKCGCYDITPQPVHPSYKSLESCRRNITRTMLSDVLLQPLQTNIIYWDYKTWKGVKWSPRAESSRTAFSQVNIRSASWWHTFT